MAEEIQGDYREKAALMGTHIIHDLEDSMIRRVHGDISSTLEIYRTYNEVEEVRIFDKNGKEGFAQEPGHPETRVEGVLRKGTPIQFQKKINERSVATFIIPIKSKPACQSCHEKGEAFRGALLLSLNQEGMKKYIGHQEQRFFILFGLIAMATIGATVIAVKRFFLNPLKSIQVGAEPIEKGDFKYQIPVKSRNEVGMLARSFNHMAQTLQTFFEEIREKNRQLSDQFLLVSRSQREWQETFDCITDAVVVIDSHCTIMRANKAFRETFKEAFREDSSLPQNGAIHRKCDELFGACFLSDCPHKTNVKERRPMTREIHGQQTGKIFEVSLFPYHSAEGDFIGSVAIIKDVTEKKENEMQVVMSERLAALGEMASGIAHELNNPLATIAACTEALLNRMEKEKIGPLLFQSYLRIIEEEINRCKSITTSMLSFVRKTDNEKQGININGALDRAIEMLTFQGRLKDVVYLRNFQTEMPQVQGNESKLRQVFITIIGNALDAMEDRGTLTIETGTAGNTVFTKISDTGPGIPPHLINRIFDPFFTTKVEKGGTGLGLSIADKIIKENNGRIDVMSEEGNGATFTITLPI